MKVEFVESINQIPAADWDSLWATNYPFTRHAFLLALEQSGCTTAATGWLPQHCIVRDDDERLQAVMPLYLKFHSYGEYVFDWSWADAWHQSGLAYYPKLLNAIPFTPATGPRWASRERRFEAMLFSAVNDRMTRDQLSGFHSLFPADTTDVTPHLQRRLGCQFHWFNRSFEHFEDFLETFNARKRKMIKRERRKVVDQKFTLETVSGDALTADDWQGFNRLYQRTYLKRSGHQGYLNAAFFQDLGEGMSQQVMMVKAYLAGEWIAAALYLFDADTLYGRYWGATEEFDGLHFECCYYRGIEYAIANRLQRFDSGAQGEHKIQRGFTPVITQSFHQLRDPRLADAVSGFLYEESKHIAQYCTHARTMLPFHVDIDVVEPMTLLDQSGNEIIPQAITPGNR